MRNICILLFLFFTCLGAGAGEISENEEGGLVLRSNGRQNVYSNIVGDQDGFDRRLIYINGFPALRVAARFEFYYTLVVKHDGILIDCAYADARNIYNGVRVSAGVCGLNVKLSENYDEIAQDYSNIWTESIFSFDTSPVFKDYRPTSFLLGRVGSIEVYDRYPSAAALENAAPQKYIRGTFGCFNFGNSLGFPVFLSGVKNEFKYLDILRSTDPMVFQRMQEQDLIKIAVDECE